MNAKNRSRAYPALDLREAVGALRKLLKTNGSEKSDRDTIAQALGHSNGSSGIAGRKIAALMHFGLLEKSAEGYRLTELARHISTAVSKEGLQRAFDPATLPGSCQQIPP